MKKNNLFLLLFLIPLFFFSCKKEFTDSVFIIVLLSGDNQKGLPNEKLQNEVIVQVLRDGHPFFSAPVIFETSSGSVVPGTPAFFSNNVASTDAAGKLHLSWTLGCLGDQEIILKLASPGSSQSQLIDGTAKILGELKVHASAESVGGWTKSCGLDGSFLNFDLSTKFMEIGDDLFMIASNDVFLSKNGGVDWNQVKTPFGFNTKFVSAFTEDQSGNYFIAFPSNGVFFSKDKGVSWSSVSTNFFFSQPTKIFSSGNVLLLNDASSGLYRSENNGVSWSQISVAGSFFGNYNQIVEAPDGKWWTWDDVSNRLAKSDDKGKTWTIVALAANLQAFPATYMTVTADGHILYLYQNGPKLMDFNPATATGTVKSFNNNPAGCSFVALLQNFDGTNYVDVYNNFGTSLGIYTGTGNGTYSNLDPGTAEVPQVFYRTKNEKLIIGNPNGLFVKL